MTKTVPFVSCMYFGGKQRDFVEQMLSFCVGVFPAVEFRKCGHTGNIGRKEISQRTLNRILDSDCNLI